MNQEKINFHVVRDFSELFNIATKFLSQNFQHFFKTLLFIAGPFILISSIFGAFHQSHTLQIIKNSTVSGRFNMYSNVMSQLGWEYFVFLFFTFCSGMVLIATVYSYVIAYNVHGPNNFEVNDVRDLVRKNILKVIKSFFILFLILIAIVTAISTIGVLFVSALNVLGAVLLVIIFLGLFIFSPPFIWQFSVFYLPILTDDLGVSEALRRVRGIMRGEFFSTWVLIVAAVVILAVLSVVFSIPQAIYQGLLEFGGTDINNHRVPFMIITTICTFCSTFIYSIFYIVCAFQYYSLSEKKEGTALINRIDEIGNTPSNDVEQQY